MHEVVREILTDEEQSIAEPVLLIPGPAFDLNACRVENDGSFVRLFFVATGKLHCPFELHFGRGAHRNRVNFYVGRGGEVFAYELAETKWDRQELAGDVDRFLRSTVYCEQRISRTGNVLTELYSPSKMLIDGRPVRIQYKSRGWSIFGEMKRMAYEPWLL